MINLEVILEAIVNKWRTVPGVLEAMGGDPETIYYVLTGRPGSPAFDAASSKAPWPSILVSHVATGLGFRGAYTHWRHTFRADLRLMGDDVTDYSTLIANMVDGIPLDNNQLTLMQCSFVFGLDSMEDVVFVRDTSVDGKDFYRMEFALQEQT